MKIQLGPGSEAILNLEFLDFELYAVIEDIFDCLPGRGWFCPMSRVKEQGDNLWLED